MLVYIIIGFALSTAFITLLLNQLPDLTHSTFLLSVVIVVTFTLGFSTSRVYDEHIEPLLILHNLKKARQELGLEPKEGEGE